VPSWHSSALYAYFVVGVIGAALVPYEVYFYSSGAIEDRWSVQDLNLTVRTRSSASSSVASCRLR